MLGGHAMYHSNGTMVARCYVGQPLCNETVLQLYAQQWGPDVSVRKGAQVPIIIHDPLLRGPPPSANRNHCSYDASQLSLPTHRLIEADAQPAKQTLPVQACVAQHAQRRASAAH